MENACCFIGHREIDENQNLISLLYTIIYELISKKSVDTFYFGSKSQFNTLCYRAVTDLKLKYPFIKRIYVRSKYPYISKEYKNYLLSLYEDTYYPESLFGSGRASYVKRNCEIIDKSEICVLYYDEKNAPKTRKSGSKTALDYAVKKGKKIILLPQNKYLG